MADIVVTPASVIAGSGKATATGTAAETITAGQTVYADSTTVPPGQLRAAKADTAARAAVVGIALHGSLAGQPLTYQTAGNLTFNAVITPGKEYVASPANVGGIAPIADLGVSNYTTLLGTGTSTTNLLMGVNPTGAVN